MFHLPFDILASVIYGTELVMWIGIMICGLVLGTGEKEEEEQQETELPRVEPSRSQAPSVASRTLSGQYPYRLPLYRIDQLPCSDADVSQIQLRSDRDLHGSRCSIPLLFGPSLIAELAPTVSILGIPCGCPRRTMMLYPYKAG